VLSCLWFCHACWKSRSGVGV